MAAKDGAFEIKRMTYDDAAFVFNKAQQPPRLVTVRVGDNENMCIAVVRQMIVIIREYTQTDLVWRSARHDGDVKLSARPADNAALEDFLLNEFFSGRCEPRR